MTAELSRRLLALGVPRPEFEAALFVSVVRGVAIARALIDRGVLTERVLEEDLSRAQGFALEQVTAAEELTVRLPPSMCRRLGAVPIRLDAFSNTAEVAAIDAQDPHVQAEFAFHLGLEVRVVRATMSAVEAEIRRIELGDTAAQPARVRRRTPAFPHGAPRSSIPPPPMEEIPIPLVRRLSPASIAGGPRPASSRPRSVSSGRNPTPPQFSFGAAHVRSALAADGANGFSSEDTDLDVLDPATLEAAGRVNGASDRAPGSARHTPRLLTDGAGFVSGAGGPSGPRRGEGGPSVSFPSTPPSSARRPSERAPTPSGEVSVRAQDPALSAISPQSLVPSTELAPPRLPAMAIGPVTAHAVLEWGPASDAFARGIGASTHADAFTSSLSEPARRDAGRDTIVHAPSTETTPLATIPAAGPTLSPGRPPEDLEPAHAVDDEPPITSPTFGAPAVEDPHSPDAHPPLQSRAAGDGSEAIMAVEGEPVPSGPAPDQGAPPAWDERTEPLDGGAFGYDDLPHSPDSNTRFIDRSPEDVLPEALDTLSGALDRDELIAALIEVATMVAERVGVFVVKKDGFHGWACNDAFGDAAALRLVRISSKVPNILATATAAGFYLGPVPHTPGHRDLIAVMGNTDREVSVNVASVATRPVLVLVSDGFGDTLRTTKVLGEMMRVAGLTLGRLLQMR